MTNLSAARFASGCGLGEALQTLGVEDLGPPASHTFHRMPIQTSLCRTTGAK